MVKDGKEKCILKPTHLARFWTAFRNNVIDEFCVGENYIENVRVKTSEEVHGVEPSRICSIDDYRKLNNQLLMGECVDQFWNESLKLSFCLSSLHFNLFSKYEEAEEAFCKIVTDQLVPRLIEQLQKLS